MNKAIEEAKTGGPIAAANEKAKMVVMQKAIDNAAGGSGVIDVPPDIMRSVAKHVDTKDMLKMMKTMNGM